MRTDRLRIDIDPSLHLEVLPVTAAARLYQVVDANRGHLRRWLPWLDTVTSAADCAAFLERSRLGYAAESGFQMGIHWQEGLVGMIGYHAFDRINRVTSLGYWLAAGACGRGIMTRAVAALTAHAFQQEGMHRLYVRCATGNRASRAIPERLGFRHEGCQRAAEWLYDRYVDLEVYAVLAAEWPTEKSARGGG